MKTPITLLYVSALAILACSPAEKAAPGGNAAPASGESRPLVLKGSDTMVVLGQRFSEEFMKNNPGSVVGVNGGGSGTGIAALINGTTDIAQSSRSMEEDEKRDVEAKRGAPVTETPIAIDALSIFLNSTNPVAALSMEQIAGIYGGKIRNWKEVGGADAPIITYGRENSSGTYAYFREHVLNKKDFSPAVQTLQGTSAVVNAVSKDRNGIGYGGIAYSSEVKLAAVSGGAGSPAVVPSSATVADGTYPLSRKLFFYYLSNAPERVGKFVSWVISPEGQKLVEAVGYFPLNTTATAAPAATTATASDTGATK